MNRKIKLIWDFRGPAAAKTAAHHNVHLKEFISINNLELNQTGIQHFNEFHSIAFMAIHEKQLQTIKTALKPHRAEVWIES